MSNALAVSDREFGELAQMVKGLQKDLSKVEVQVNSVDGKVDSVLSRFDRIDGGWKVLIAVGGVMGVIASVLTTIAIKSWPLLIGTLPKV